MAIAGHNGKKIHRAVLFDMSRGIEVPPLRTKLWSSDLDQNAFNSFVFMVKSDFLVRHGALQVVWVDWKIS